MNDNKKPPADQQPRPDASDPVLKGAVRATDPPPAKKEPRPADYPNLGGEVD